MKAGKIIEKIKTKDGHEAVIRYIKFEDWPECLQLINSLVKEDAKINANKRVSKSEELEWISWQLKSLEKGESIAICAEVNGRVVGMCDIHRKKYRQSHIASLGISIAKAYRGIGIGKALMKKALELAKKELKVKMVILGVFENNRIARKLYKKLGFKVYGKLPKALQYKGKYVTSVYMYKEL